MINSQENAHLINLAQLGDKEALNRLAETARIYLSEYVFRVTLKADLTQDIVQECILEMYKVFHNLKNTDRFRAWLDGIAFNKIRSYYGRKWRHKTIPLYEVGCELATDKSQSALAEMINKEFKEIVLKSMHEISPRHRAVLAMRCYKGMPYSEIAEAMGCTEFGVQALFYRAKKALAKKLSCHGLGKESLLLALVLFGKLTAATEASAASIIVTSAALKVSTAASITALITSKTALVSLTAAALFTGGVLTNTQTIEKNTTQNSNTEIIFNKTGAAGDTGQSWYYFPEESGTSVMIRKLNSNEPGGQTYCRYLQNQHANYYYENDNVYIKNSRAYNRDLSVVRLPTDDKDLSDFLSRVEGKKTDMEYIPGRKKGLLVISGNLGDDKIKTFERSSSILEEEYFQFDWPQSVQLSDNRDPMHKRGWTYFTVEGIINGKQVTGTGQMPFVYEKLSQINPWIKIQLADGSMIIDTKAGAYIANGSGKTLEIYEGGSFFDGLSRPWTGLHTIDTVRRDAAKERVWFETKLSPGTENAEVVLTYEQTKLIYTIDMKNDLIEKIAFSTPNSNESELRFTYLQNIDDLGNKFQRPKSQSSVHSNQDSVGMLWLVKLINNSR